MTQFFFKNPVGKVLFDIVAAAVIGAGSAAYALPGDATTKTALGAILGGAIGAVKSAGREAVLGAIVALRAYRDSQNAPPTGAVTVALGGGGSGGAIAPTAVKGGAGDLGGGGAIQPPKP